jgi:RNA polymerase sigma-70 factor (ECF subfamily)
MEDLDVQGEEDSLNDSSLDIRIAIGKLNDKYKAILAMHYYQGLTYEDIAETLSCPVGTIKSRINYALKM